MNVESIISSAIKKTETGNNKKDNRLKQIESQEVEIIENSKSSWEDIYVAPKSQWVIKKDSLLNWNQRDFTIYMSGEFKEKYHRIWDMKSTLVVTYLGNIKESIREYFGFCDNIVLKDYIDYFYNNWLDYYVLERKSKFWLRDMREYSPIDSFISSYNYKASVKQTNVKDKFSEDQQEIQKEKDVYVSLSDVEDFYLLSVNSLVLNFCVIIPVNFFMMEKNMSKENAFKKVSCALLDIYNKESKVLNDILDINNNFEYPSDFVFKDIKEFKMFFETKCGIDFSFNEEIKFNEFPNWKIRRVN